MYMQNSLLFPREAIRHLRSARGEQFTALVDRVCVLPECHEEALAFMLMMIQLNGCVSCATDSYRAMNGCTVCALRVLKRFKGSDQDLIDRYEDALNEVRLHNHQNDTYAIPVPAGASSVLIHS
ncbi:MAG: hypothetical protein MUF38_00250 [Anaerolineae bacterium]|jgi:hypothetical protein|nr:hypothetical protein [Anaerolineae bacterium]